jgi:hypothetical protein
MSEFHIILSGSRLHRNRIEHQFVHLNRTWVKPS